MKRSAFAVGLFLASVAGSSWAAGSLADVNVYDRTSQRLLPIYTADGGWFVAGKVGGEYELRIRNNTGEDLLAVVSVDGVNVVTGETAATAQGGYVVSAWQSLNIPGWRKSLARVASFYFTEHSAAYATRTGRPNDVGVIGFALFKRKAVPPVEIEPQSRLGASGFARDAGRSRLAESDDAPAQAAPEASVHNEAPAKESAKSDASLAARAPAALAPRPPERRIGTGHGRSQSAPARYVAFERESDTPNEVIAVRYDTYANLVAQGVIPAPRGEPNENGIPNPFPARFVPDPPRRW